MIFFKKKLPIIIFTGIIILAVYSVWNFFIPVKLANFKNPRLEVNSNIDTISNKHLIPLGKTVGIKLYCDGVLIVKFSEINTIDGIKNPSKVAGLKENDLIKSVNGKRVFTTEDMIYIINQNNDQPIEIEFLRNKETMKTSVTPQRSISDNKLKLGVFIRDSAAGIGTMTYFDPSTNEFGGLGHGICDIDTNKILSIGNGSVTDVSITDIKKGSRGDPGEIRGIFVESENAKFGNITSNNQTGIYGNIFNKMGIFQNNALEIAKKDDIRLGTAYILADVSGEGTQRYEIDIERIYNFSDKETKNMMIKITDPRLLELTGGIVQGMSGSPIIQDNKIIGAVTHVLVNDPTRGYGVFIENMLKNAPSFKTDNINNLNKTCKLAA